MQKLLEKQLTFEDIIDYYRAGESEKECIGLEYERISLDKKTFCQPDFKNLTEIIKAFSKINNWQQVFDNETIIGAKNNQGSSVSLEPGGQFELSLSPRKSLIEIHFYAKSYLEQIDILGEKYGVKFFPIGNNPKTTFNKMEILNKRRYKIMASYLPKIGAFAPVMMRETAGVQINVDYKNECDAERKIRACALISPFLTGFFANSPFRNNKLTNYKSFRALAWKYTGANRCNLFYKNIIDFKGNIYEKYANYILDVPMIFIIRNDKYIEINGKINFREFLQNGYLGYRAEKEDYLIHQSLCFPDIRLKNCIEIRNHDSQNLEVAIGIGAIYKGILYNENALDEILNFLDGFKTAELEHFGFIAAKTGINFKAGKLDAADIVRKILYIAQYNLNKDEQKYLDWLIDLARNKKCIADLVLEGVKTNS